MSKFALLLMRCGNTKMACWGDSRTPRCK